MSASIPQDDRNKLRTLERFEAFFDYVYPIAMNMQRCHVVLRDRLLHEALNVSENIITAARIKQVSRLHKADAAIEHIRFILRAMSRKKVKGITPDQLETAMKLLAEPGAMIGTWIGTWQAKKG